MTIEALPSLFDMCRKYAAEVTSAVPTQTAAPVQPPIQSQPLKPSAEEVAAAEKAALAPFHGSLDAIQSGKNLVNSLDLSAAKPFFDKGRFGDVGLQELIPTTDIDKMTPSQLARVNRAYLALSHENVAKAYPELAKARIFANPMNKDDPKARLDLGTVAGLAADRLSKYTPEERAAYDKDVGTTLETSLPFKNMSGTAQSVALEEQKKAQTQLVDSLKKVETDPKGTGFSDWFMSSWSNIAVPAGFLMMLFGGNTGAILGGIAIAAGGYDIYNRYNTLTKDPAAGMAIKEFIDGGFSQDALAKIKETYGDKYARAAMDFMAASRYGFLTQAQNAITDTAMKRMRAFTPGMTDPQAAEVRKKMEAGRGATTWANDWANKGWDYVRSGGPFAAKPAPTPAPGK